jgi:hypothetical protein
MAVMDQADALSVAMSSEIRGGRAAQTRVSAHDASASDGDPPAAGLYVPFRTISIAREAKWLLLSTAIAI